MNKAEKKALRKDVKKVAKEIPKERALMAGSHYFETLADPFNNNGEKIPDDINYPSATFTIVDRRVLDLNVSGFGTIVYGIAGGNGADTYGSLVPCSMLNAAALFGDQQKERGTYSREEVEKAEKNLSQRKGSVKANSSTPESVTYDFFVGTMTGASSVGASPVNVLPSEASGYQFPFRFPEWTASTGVPTLFDKVRLVSGGMSVDYLGTALNAKGSISIAAVPRRTLRQAVQNGAISIDDIQNLVGCKIIPVNKLQGGTCTYHPVDTVSNQYVDMRSLYDESSLVNRDSDCALGSELWCVVNGAESNASLQITAVFNYEAIPSRGTLNLIQPSYSRNDPIEMSMAMNAIEKVPTAAIGNKSTKSIENGTHSQIEAMSAPSASKVVQTEEQREEGEEESFLTKVLDGAEGVLSKAPGIIGKATPLVRQALGFLGV